MWIEIMNMQIDEILIWEICALITATLKRGTTKYLGKFSEK